MLLFGFTLVIVLSDIFLWLIVWSGKPKNVHGGHGVNRGPGPVNQIALWLWLKKRVLVACLVAPVAINYSPLKPEKKKSQTKNKEKEIFFFFAREILVRSINVRQ